MRAIAVLPGTPDSVHLAELAKPSIDEVPAAARTRGCACTRSSTPRRRPSACRTGNPSAAGIRAFYFKDPDGHSLEILWFPPGMGDARWHRAGDRLFLGLDHTAIVVADTDRSLACYRDALGLRTVGQSDNHGPEQERLNNVFGARLRITTLRASAGPGIELLQYLDPGRR
jgi:catechol 2,3-dioxygenase-like lactoylglutathione lyase family enzyme